MNYKLATRIDWKRVRLLEGFKITSAVMHQQTTEILARRLWVKMFGGKGKRRGWY
jgi:hypothetical protein